MAGPHTFIGSVSGDFANGPDWDTGLVPQNGEAWLMNHRTLRSITSGLNQAAKTFSKVSRHPSCPYGIASAVASLECNITELHDAGSGEPAYVAGTLTNVHVDSPSRTSPGLSLDAIVSSLSMRQGLVELRGTRVLPASSRINVHGVIGADPGECLLRISAATVDLTTNNTLVTVTNGQLETSASIDDLILGSGLVSLNDAAALLKGELLGGSLHWNSSGTITEARCAGDHLFTLNNFDLVRTLVTMSMHGSCVVDLSGGFNLSITNPIRRQGGQLIEPFGRTLTVI